MFLQALDPYGLRIDKSMGPEMRKLSAVPAVLDAADWNPRIRRGKTIDKDPARVKIASDPASSSNQPKSAQASQTRPEEGPMKHLA